MTEESFRRLVAVGFGAASAGRFFGIENEAPVGLEAEGGGDAIIVLAF